MTYKEYICDQLEDYDTGQPIYTSKIALKLASKYQLQKNEASAATAVVFKRIMDDSDFPNLRFYQKGIYYLAASTPFGETGINKECLIADKYLLPCIGYETGYTMLHRIGLTSQFPKERCLASNKATGCARMDYKLGVMVRPPKTTITKENKSYLQFLDILDLMNKAPIDAEQPYVLLSTYIQETGLKYERLLSLAYKYYNKQTILQLAHTASEGGV